MAHSEHNRARRSGGFFLIIAGAFIFITAPIYLKDSPTLGMTAIITGFVIGGIGFYLNFIRDRKSQNMRK